MPIKLSQYKVTDTFDSNAVSYVEADDTTDIGSPGTIRIEIIGQGLINSFSIRAEGAMRWVRFVDAGTVITHNSTALILPGSADITVQAGDTALFVSMGSGNWRCVFYQRADGKPLIAPASSGGSGAAGSPLMMI